jgi:hypothetical protein
VRRGYLSRASSTGGIGDIQWGPPVLRRRPGARGGRRRSLGREVGRRRSAIPAGVATLLGSARN